MPKGYCGGTPYLKRGSWRPVDGSGRIHQNLTAECVRCGEEYTVANIHDYKTEEEHND